MFYSILIGTSAASVLALLLITVDRYIIITYSLQYDVIVTPLTMAIMITTGWICAAMVTILPLAGIGAKHSSEICEMQTVLTSEFMLVLFFVSYLIPVLLMLLMYTKIAFIAKKHRYVR